MPKNLRKMEDEIGAIAKATVNRLVEAGGEADFVPLVSAPYPLHVVMQILGVPEEDEQRMLFLTQQMFGGQDEDLSGSGMKDMTPEQITQIVAGAVADFEAYFAKMAADRRANPTDDVASVIANATVNGEPLNDRDMAGYYIIVASAGHDTTSASTAGAMMALAQDPEQFARVKADRDLLPGIVEEAIRWTTPVQHFMRTAAEDTEIAGQKPVQTLARKSIAGFKLREGMAIGCKVTLQRQRMYEFLDRLISIVLPRVRDFRGVSRKAFDGKGSDRQTALPLGHQLGHDAPDYR